MDPDPPLQTLYFIYRLTDHLLEDRNLEAWDRARGSVYQDHYNEDMGGGVLGSKRSLVHAE